MKQKILHSIQLLQKAEKIALSYDPGHGYYLAFSGGKDSQCLYHIAHDVLMKTRLLNTFYKKTVKIWS